MKIQVRIDKDEPNSPWSTQQHAVLEVPTEDAVRRITDQIIGRMPSMSYVHTAALEENVQYLIERDPLEDICVQLGDHWVHAKTDCVADDNPSVETPDQE